MNWMTVAICQMKKVVWNHWDYYGPNALKIPLHLGDIGVAEMLVCEYQLKKNLLYFKINNWKCHYWKCTFILIFKDLWDVHTGCLIVKWWKLNGSEG